MWARCSSWEFQEFQVINLSDLHPCQACRKEPKFSQRLVSKLNSIHTCAGAFYQPCMGRVLFVPSFSFLCLEQQNASLLLERRNDSFEFSWMSSLGIWRGNIINVWDDESALLFSQTNFFFFLVRLFSKHSRKSLPESDPMCPSINFLTSFV